MVHLVCPLCGKSFYAESYDPSEFEDDIIAQEFKGKGRGKGFEVIDKYSILIDDEFNDIVKSMADRSLRIVKLFFDSGYLTDEEIDDVFSESS